MRADHFGPQWKCQWCEPGESTHYDSRLLSFLQQTAQASDFQLVIQHFASRLVQKQMLRLVFREYFKEQTTRCLHLSRRFACAWVTLEYKAGHASNLSELTPSQFGSIQALQQILQQPFRA